MDISLAFWILMLFWLVLGFWANYTPGQPFYKWGSWNLLLFILVGMLGWKVFGRPIH